MFWVAGSLDFQEVLKSFGAAALLIAWIIEKGKKAKWDEKIQSFSRLLIDIYLGHLNLIVNFNARLTLDPALDPDKCKIMKDRLYQNAKVYVNEAYIAAKKVLSLPESDTVAIDGADENEESKLLGKIQEITKEIEAYQALTQEVKDKSNAYQKLDELVHTKMDEFVSTSSEYFKFLGKKIHKNVKRWDVGFKISYGVGGLALLISFDFPMYLLKKYIINYLLAP